jgi:hypothetical protein
MDLDERHEDFAGGQLSLCPACDEWYPEDEGVLMNLGGVEWDAQPTWCPGCASEARHATEGYGVR